MDRIVDQLQRLLFDVLDALRQAVGVLLDWCEPLAHSIGIPVEWIVAAAGIVFAFVLYRGLATFAEKQR
jgi:hypothetical protein